uniref:ATP-dependent Clp protease proteolytic subunit n=1 Tax=Pityopus californicus TaxID=176255 RepID=A0A221SR56_9ERIC|nr:ATP-dependent Clp protease proteolytic subunit [Pityopus californicus]ASN79027.1 ATP-dependent Clp protease proteolytic subunit [Pityopus californicus]
MLFDRNGESFYRNGEPFDDPFYDPHDDKGDKKEKREKKEKKEPKDPIIPQIPFIEIEEVEELESVENEPNDSEDEYEDEEGIIYKKKIYYEEVVNYIDLYSFLYKNGIIFLWENLTMEVANKIIQLIICLDLYGDAPETTSVLINCSKGSPLAARTLCNFMNEGAFIDVTIETIGCGRVGGPGIYALLGGRPRFAFPNCKFLISRPNFKVNLRTCRFNSKLEAEINIKLKIRRDLEETFTEKTGQPPEFIKNIRTGRYMSATEAREYGIIDEIIRDLNFKKPEDETQEKSYKNEE